MHVSHVEGSHGESMNIRKYGKMWKSKLEKKSIVFIRCVYTVCMTDPHTHTHSSYTCTQDIITISPTQFALQIWNSPNISW